MNEKRMPEQIALFELSENGNINIPSGGASEISRKIQLAHKYADIISHPNLLFAWEEFVVGKKNKKDVQEFARNLMDNIVSLHEDLKHQKYQHGGYEHFVVSDPKRRDIHKASVRDRLLHHAVYRILYPFFDRTFIADSYSCRVNKGMHRAINRFRSFAYQVSRNHTRTCWVLKCDIQKFFGSIDHEILLSILQSYIPDKEIMGLVRNVVGSFCSPLPLSGGARGGLSEQLASVKDRQDLYTRQSVKRPLLTSPGRGGGDIGLPLGNLTSQLFSNIYLNVFDQWVKHQLSVETPRRYVVASLRYVRYADDFVFLSHDKQSLERIIPYIQQFLAEQLHLTLHPKKISLKTFASCVDFLGWVHFPDHRILRKVTKRRMFTRIAEHPTEETLYSYLGMLTHGNTRKVREDVLGRWWLCQE